MKQVEVAIAIIQRAGLVLVCQRRKKDMFADLWEFPGGKMEPSEPPAACVIREVREELGIEVKPTEAFSMIEHRYPTFDLRLHPYLCEIEAGDPQPLASQRLQWVEPVALRDFAFPQANAPLLEQVIARLHDDAETARIGNKY